MLNWSVLAAHTFSITELLHFSNKFNSGVMKVSKFAVTQNGTFTYCTFFGLWMYIFMFENK